MVTGVKFTSRTAESSLERTHHNVHEIAPGLELGHEVFGEVNTG
jgi:hypothetical protein